jgi:Lon protease-like protein
MNEDNNDALRTKRPSLEKNAGPKAGNIRDYIIEAVSLAHQAVQADNEVEPDIEKARRLYRDVAQRLEHIAPFVPEEHAKILNKFVSGMGSMLIHFRVKYIWNEHTH